MSLGQWWNPFGNRNRDTPALPIESEPLPYGLIILCEGKEPIVDIVAVHGLNGHRERTWTANSVNWLRDLLPADIPYARIMSWGYDANTHSSSPISAQYLYDHAKALISDLCLQRGLTKTQKRPIIFVAHSLGGIIVKSALIHSDSARQNALEEHRSIKLSTYGILFMGTPHQGGNGVHLGELMLQIASIFVTADNKILKHLERDSEWLQQQLGQYAPISNDFVTKFAYEMFPTPIALGKTAMIVPLASATVPSAADAEHIAIPANHLNMVKFGSREAAGYRKVSGHLLLLTEKAPTTIGARWEEHDRIVVAHTTRLSVNWEQLRNTLRPDVAIDYQSKNRLARLPSTSDWVFEDDSFKKWENGEAAIPLLWIRGGPGSGKSVIAASIIHRLEGRAKTSSSLRRFAVAYFYCRHDMNNPQPVHTAIRTLMDQVARQIPVLAMVISEQLEIWGLLGKPESLLQYPIWEFLQELDLDGYLDERFYWVIDGVDELPVQERRDLFIVLKDALLRFRKLSILVLSRVEVDIIKELESLRACCISVASEKTEKDILAYIEHLVGAWGFLGSEPVREMVVGTIVKKANGLFLWVKLIMDELNTVIDPDQVKIVLAGFPEDMKEVYNRILVNLFSRHTQQHAQVLRSNLQWVLLARKTLTLSELAAALSPFGKFTPVSLKASFVRICGPLLELRDFNHQSSSVRKAPRNPVYPTVHLTHASLANYLRLSNDPACAFSVDEVAGHQEIAFFCVDYFRAAIQRPLFYPVNEATLYKLGGYILGKLAELWSSRGPKPIDFDSPTDDLSDQHYVHPFVRKAFPLLQYTQEYWFRHVQLSARLGPLPTAFVEKLLSVLAFGSTLHILSSLRISHIGPEILTKDFIALFADLPPNGEWEFEYLRALLLSVAKGDRTAWPNWNQPRAVAVEIEKNHLHEQISSRSSLALFHQAVRLENLGNFEHALCTYLEAFDLDSSLDEILAIPEQPTSSEDFALEILNVLESCSPLQLLILGGFLQRNGLRLLINGFLMMGNSKHGLQHLEAKASLLAASRNYLDAAGFYHKASCLDPERGDLKEARFSLLIKAQMYGEADEVLRLWGKIDDWCEGAWLCRRQASLAEASKEYEKCIDIYMQGIEQFPLCWELYRDASLLFIRLGRPSHVVRVLERARTQPSLDFLASQELIKLHTQANLITEATSVAKALTVNHRNRWDSYENLWKISTSGQPIEETSTIFEGLTLQPNPRWEPFVYLAYTYLDIEAYDSAIVACEAALRIKKHSSIVWTMAKAYESKGNLNAALDVLLSGFKEYGSRGMHADALTGVQLYRDFEVGRYYTTISILSRKTEKWEPWRWSLRNLKRMAAGPSVGKKIIWNGFGDECLALAEFKLGNLVAAKAACLDSLQESKPPGLQSRQALLAVILSCLGEDVGAVQQSLLVVAALGGKRASRWREVGRFALDYGALKLAALCLDIDLQIRNHNTGSAVDIGENTATTGLEVRHWGIRCDGCSTAEFSGPRHECVQCRDFQFCGECFSTLRAGHETGHGFVEFPTELYPRLTEAELDSMMKGDGQETAALTAWRMVIPPVSV